VRPISKIWLMIFSFLLSISLWAYVQVQENPTKPPATSYTLEVLPKNLPDGYSLVRSPEPIKVFPVGTPDEVARIDPKDLSASMDLSSPVEGSHSYAVKLTVAGDYAVRWEPQGPTATVEVQKKIAKDVPVRVQVSNGLTHTDYWYLPEQTFAEPAVIRITGPKPDVDAVVEARATLDLLKVAPGQVYSSDIELLESGNRPASRMVEADPKIVLVHPAIAVGLDTRSVHIQPAFKGQPPFGYVVKSLEVTPNEIQLRGRPEILSTMTMVTTEPVDLSQIKSTTSITIAPVLPPGVIISPPQIVTLKIVIEPLAKKPVEPSPTVKSKRRKDG
jgi:YbbR domain-containing protein